MRKECGERDQLFIAADRAVDYADVLHPVTPETITRPVVAGSYLQNRWRFAHCNHPYTGRWCSAPARSAFRSRSGLVLRMRYQGLAGADGADGAAPFSEPTFDAAAATGCMTCPLS